jgi:hypothetical protein
VRIGYGSSEAVADPSQALDYMRYRWPLERGSHYITALSCCRDAAEGQVPSEVAKEAFISAAIEAAVLA